MLGKFSHPFTYERDSLQIRCEREWSHVDGIACFRSGRRAEKNTTRVRKPQLVNRIVGERKMWKFQFFRKLADCVECWNNVWIMNHWQTGFIDFSLLFRSIRSWYLHCGTENFYAFLKTFSCGSQYKVFFLLYFIILHKLSKSHFVIFLLVDFDYQFCLSLTFLQCLLFTIYSFVHNRY